MLIIILICIYKKQCNLIKMFYLTHCLCVLCICILTLNLNMPTVLPYYIVVEK